MRPDERQVRFRARPEARKRWEQAAELRGETLSEFLRIAADERTSRQTEGEVALPSLSPQAQPARPKTLAEKLEAIEELVAGLGSSPVPGLPNRRSSASMQVRPGVSTPSFYRDTPSCASERLPASSERGKWTTTAVSTSSKTWKNVPGLAITRCTLNQVTLMVSVNVEGGPVRFRAIIDDVPEAPMKPTFSRFVPQGTESFAFTFVGRTGPFEGDDTHRFNVQWRSATGAQVTMHQGAINLLFQRGTQGCP
jgi:hypothetical protein